TSVLVHSRKTAHRAVATTGAVSLTALTFRELEAFPRTGLAGLLALLHARIPAEQTLSFQRASEIDIDLEKSTRNRKLRGASLSHDAAAGCVNRQIVGIYRLGSLKRLQHDVCKGTVGK